MGIVDRFLDYVSWDTQSDDMTNMTPSTPGQMDFAIHLKEIMEDMKLCDVSLDDNG